VIEPPTAFSPSIIQLTVRILFLTLALLPASAGLRAQTPEDAARALARRIADVRELPAKVALQWSNASSMPEAQSVLLREAFLKEFSAHRVVLAAPPAMAAGVQLSVRETPTEFLLVARVLTASGDQIHITELPRAAFSPVLTSSNGLRLTKELLWQQTAPILDAREVTTLSTAPSSAGATNLFVLQPEALALYRESDQLPTQVQELPFPPAYKYASRALRGELDRAPDATLAAALPGMTCNLREPLAAAERWTMNCATRTGENLAPNLTTAGSSNPGSSIPDAVALTSACDGSAWRLMAEDSDWTRTDRLLLVNSAMKREEAVATTDFPGPIRRIHEAENGKSAIAVVFNLSSGSYEIYRVNLSCGR
jgi:hypothetical protein